MVIYFRFKMLTGSGVLYGPQIKEKRNTVLNQKESVIELTSPLYTCTVKWFREFCPPNCFYIFGPKKKQCNTSRNCDNLIKNYTRTENITVPIFFKPVVSTGYFSSFFIRHALFFIIKFKWKTRKYLNKTCCIASQLAITF